MIFGALDTAEGSTAFGAFVSRVSREIQGEVVGVVEDDDNMMRSKIAYDKNIERENYKESKVNLLSITLSTNCTYYYCWYLGREMGLELSCRPSFVIPIFRFHADGIQEKI